MRDLLGDAIDSEQADAFANAVGGSALGWMLNRAGWTYDCDPGTPVIFRKSDPIRQDERGGLGNQMRGARDRR